MLQFISVTSLWNNCQQFVLSYDTLIGRNAVMWHWALSYVHLFTVTRGDVEAVTWRSLNTNVRYILHCFRLSFVCLFVFLFFFHRMTKHVTHSRSWGALVWVVIFPCPTHYRASSVKCQPPTQPLGLLVWMCVYMCSIWRRWRTLWSKALSRLLKTWRRKTRRNWCKRFSFQTLHQWCHTHTLCPLSGFSAVNDTACIVSGIGSVKWSSVCPSVCLIDRELQWHAVGLLLSTLRAGDIDR